MLSVNFVSALQGALKIPELRARILFVFAMFTVYAVGLHIPIPGVDREQLQRIFEDQQLLEFLNMFTGGALRKLTILALGLNPYITASIIMQIFSYADPRMREMLREEAGRRLMQQRVRLLTIAIAVVQAIGLIATFRSAGALELTGIQYVQVVIAWTAGAMFLLWLGEQITEKGLGNGVSLMIFASIVASMPYQVARTYEAVRDGAVSFGQVLLLLVIFIATVWGVVYVTTSQRRIPIQYMRRIVGRRQTVGGSSYLPIPLNAAGVIPIIFAISLQLLPATILQMIPYDRQNPGPFFSFMESFVQLLTPGGTGWIGVFGSLLYAFLIFIFTYFYVSVVFNTDEIAETLKRQGAFIQGVRPGKPTADYLNDVLTRITFVGAAFLAFIALMQYWVPTITRIDTLTIVGGTSLLILVGVAIDFARQLQAQLAMRQYDELMTGKYARL
ncbi:MAG: preprotein translocase subunit SecY [Armatimonadota bacterium]|nr:preprotein translocase subunit SecY [Armatimonadota bacterium]